MFIRRPLLLVLFLLFALVSSAGAWTSRTPESSALGDLKSLIKFFESENKRLPESWKELEDLSGKPLDQSYPLVLPTLRYELFSPPLELRINASRSMHVLAITRKPMWETTREGNMGRTLALKGPGRYLLHRQQNGDWRAEWFPETTIQRLWPSTGRALPVEDQEPERPWVKAARWQILMKRLGFAAVVGLVVWWIVVRWRGKRNSQAIQAVG